MSPRKVTYPLLAATLVLTLSVMGRAQTAAPIPPQPGNTVLIAQYQCSPGDLAITRDGRKLYVICAGGGRSTAAAEFLANRGFLNVHNVEGGMNSWKGPVERT